MHPKVARALRAARRPYADGGDVVRERATILPLGTYGDGTTRAAWPGVIYEPAAAAKRLVDYFMGGNYRPGDDEATRQLAEDSFTAASAMPVAGLAAAAVRPGVSLGSGGGKLAKSLPMDEASRMARAREMGFDLPAYHATSAEFTEFKPGYRGASFFADSPASAEKGATGGSADWYGARNSADRIMPVMLRSKHIAGLNLTPKERAWWEGLPDRITDEKAIESLKMPSHNIDYWWRVYDEVQNPDGTFTYVKKPVPSTTIDEVRSTGRDVYGSKYLGGYEGEQGAARLAREAGMDGFILSDEAGIGIGIADPRRIRSKFAAFDPDQIDSANILAANSSKAASPGLAALESNRVRGGMGDASQVGDKLGRGLAHYASDEHYPQTGLNPIHPVDNWAYVRKLVRAARRGEEITPILYDGLPNNGNLLAGTHRSAANEIIKKTGKGNPIDMVALDDVLSDPTSYGLTRRDARRLREAVEDGDFDAIDSIWDQR